jgi:integrase
MPKQIPQQPETIFRMAKPKDKTYRISDGDGLYMEVMPNGKKRWRWQYTRPTGGRTRLGLGDYPTVSTKQARIQRDEARRLVTESIDPAQHRRELATAQEERTANNFEYVGREWMNKQRRNWTDGHATTIESRLQNDVFPWIGSRPVAEITAPELLKVLCRVEERGAIETAHRIRSYCGQIMRYAIATGRAERDPSADLRGALPPAKPTHLAAVTERADMRALLHAIDGYSGSIVTRCALRLAPLVFVRPGELRRARWVDIDLAAREWRYEVSKTKTGHIVPLCTQAVEILEEIHPLTGHREYVFPSLRGQGRPMSENTINVALRSLGFDGKTMTGHGFRAMARTALDEVLGYPIHIIEQQLAHAVRDPLGRAYNRTTHLDQRREMMQAWGNYLDELRANNVTPFNRHQAAKS